MDYDTSKLFVKLQDEENNIYVKKNNITTFKEIKK